MSAITKANLLDSLKTEYPHAFTRNEDGTWSFRVDDRDSGDVSYLFCSISLTTGILEADTFRLEMSNLPSNWKAEEVAAELKGVWSGPDHERKLSFNASRKQYGKINKLAKAIRRVVGRGRRYPYPHWKWSAPRTADSLERLAECLRTAHRILRQPSRNQDEEMTLFPSQEAIEIRNDFR